MTTDRTMPGTHRKLTAAQEIELYRYGARERLRLIQDFINVTTFYDVLRRTGTAVNRNTGTGWSSLGRRDMPSLRRRGGELRAW